MNGDSVDREIVYCADDEDYRLYSNICDKLVIETYYKNHLNSGAHIKSIQKKQSLNISSYQIYVMSITDNYDSVKNCTINEKEDNIKIIKFLFLSSILLLCLIGLITNTMIEPSITNKL